MALILKGSRFDTFSDKFGFQDVKDVKDVKEVTSLKSILLTVTATFVASMLAYLIMYIIFGFGGGMLSE